MGRRRRRHPADYAEGMRSPTIRPARQGDLGPFEGLVEVLRQPFVERPEWERYAQPAPERFAASYVTFCGT